MLHLSHPSRWSKQLSCALNKLFTLSGHSTNANVLAFLSATLIVTISLVRQLSDSLKISFIQSFAEGFNPSNSVSQLPKLSAFICVSRFCFFSYLILLLSPTQRGNYKDHKADNDSSVKFLLSKKMIVKCFNPYKWMSTWCAKWTFEKAVSTEP